MTSSRDLFEWDCWHLIFVFARHPLQREDALGHVHGVLVSWGPGANFSEFGWIVLEFLALRGRTETRKENRWGSGRPCAVGDGPPVREDGKVPSRRV